MSRSEFERTLAWGARDSARRYQQRTQRERRGRQQEDRRRQQPQSSTWTPAASLPPFGGVIEGTDDVVSFKTGGPQGDRTLISDGDYTDDRDGFNNHHNDYGSRRESPGEYFAEDRGYYTGPFH